MSSFVWLLFTLNKSHKFFSSTLCWYQADGAEQTVNHPAWWRFCGTEAQVSPQTNVSVLNAATKQKSLMLLWCGRQKNKNKLVSDVIEKWGCGRIQWNKSTSVSCHESLQLLHIWDKTELMASKNSSHTSGQRVLHHQMVKWRITLKGRKKERKKVTSEILCCLPE